MKTLLMKFCCWGCVFLQFAIAAFAPSSEKMKRSLQPSLRKAVSANADSLKERWWWMIPKEEDGTTTTTTRPLPPHIVANPRYFGHSLLTIRVPDGFSLSQSVCSYGYFCLAPNRWVPATSPNDDDDEGFLVRPLHYNDFGESIMVAIGQWQEGVLVGFHQPRIVEETRYQQELVQQIRRMLRLDMDLTGFHRLHPEARERGYGRLYRSPTLFEDMVKTITNCNMQWAGTMDMNAKLCRHVGNQGAFPTPLEIQQGTSPEFLKQHCRLGYRSTWVWELADHVVRGNLDLTKLENENENTTDWQETKATLQSIKGIGEFASNNILQLMGCFESFPYDTETVRLFREEFGATQSATKQTVFALAHQKYNESYAPYQFLAYWFDLWKNYERRTGTTSPRWSIEQCESECPDEKRNLPDSNQSFQTKRTSPKRTTKKKKQTTTKKKKKKKSAATKASTTTTTTARKRKAAAVVVTPEKKSRKQQQQG